MRRTLSTLALSLLVLSTAAEARVRVHVVNCSPHKLTACSYDAKDKSTTAASKKRKVKPGRSRTLSCKGQGKGYCKVSVNRQFHNDRQCSDGGTKNVRKGKYLKVVKKDSGLSTTIHDSKPSCD